ncbi:MAG: 4Fe-4S dicluster domain-containing protein [Polyangia bacterium]
MTAERNEERIRLGLVIDVDRCIGCGNCSVACALENNVAVPPPEAGASRGVSWLTLKRADTDDDTAFFPVMCQHCDREPPCVEVCPQNATDVDPRTGVVSQIPERCLGCRYCMAACPFHARSFNWWDPSWPPALARGLNPEVSPRQRGVVEKCTLCHARRQAARARAAAEGLPRPGPGDVTPACAEACPARAIRIGDLGDPKSDVGAAVLGPRAFRLLESLGFENKVVYLSSRRWVHELARVEGGRLLEELRDV